MRIAESRLRKIIRKIIAESIVTSWIKQDHYDELDGSINFQNGKGDLLQNIQSFIKDDIENMSLSKVISLDWKTPGNTSPLFMLIMACHPGEVGSTMGYEFGDREVSFKVSAYPMTSGETGIEGVSDPGLTKHQIRSKFKSVRFKNTFSCQDFNFECTTNECNDFSVRVYREENSAGESKIILEFV